MRPFLRMLVIALALLSLASLQATDHDCDVAGETTCLPEDPFTLFECFGSEDGWQGTIICDGVCCQEEPSGNAGCCCRQLDCGIGQRRCFGDDMVQECQEVTFGPYNCIEWVPVTWCLELGSNFRCMDAQCIEVDPDGDSMDGDHDDDQPETDADRVDSQNVKKTVVSNENGGCRTTDGPKGSWFFIWVLALAILNRNKISDYLNS